MAEHHDLWHNGNVTPLLPRVAGTLGETTFTRHEINVLLQAYGKGVAAGEWRDYAIDFLSDSTLFSIFRRSSERPFYTVEKRPALMQKQGPFAILDQRGAVLRRGHDLSRVLLCLRPIRRLK
jgi:hypothetical protein